MAVRYFIFDKFNTWYDWRLTLTEGKDVGTAEPKTYYTELDGAHGTRDLTEALTGEVTYRDRTVTAPFVCSEGTYEEREALLRRITSALHGKKVKIIEPDDPDHFFLGRVKLVPNEKYAAYVAFTLEAACDPWRYAINETERVVQVNGAADVVIRNNGDKTLCPVLNVTGTVHITANGVKTTLAEGSYKITDIRLRQGVNILSVDGSGSVTIVYREACL